MPRIIPVLDVLRGRAVRAVGGHRENYRPLRSGLRLGSDPLTLTCAIRGAFGPIGETTAEEWDFTFAVLVRGVFLGVKHASNRMKAQALRACIQRINCWYDRTPNGKSALKRIEIVPQVGEPQAIEVSSDTVFPSGGTGRRVRG